MKEFEIKRIVVACDAAADARLAAELAAALASRHGAELRGIFFDDENLHRIAELDVAAHVGFSPAQDAPPLTGAAVQQFQQMRSRGMRRAVEAAAAQRRLAWSFDTMRALPTEDLPVGEGDMLILEAGTRPFSGGWRPRSPWLSAVIEADNTVLLHRSHIGHGIVVVASDDPQACDHLIRAALDVSPREGAIVVLTPISDIRTHIAPVHPGGSPAFRFERRPDDVLGIVARLRQLDPNFVAIGTSEDMPIKRAIAEGTIADLLIVK